MKSNEFIVEAMPQVYYHGSANKLKVGTKLTPRDDYENDWSNTDFYIPLEKYRPTDKLSHKQSVFMCDNPTDVDNAGGSTDYLFSLWPNGVVQRHDMNWGSEISMLISDGHDIDSPEVAHAAQQYWAGNPHPHDESVWEYLTPNATVLTVEEY